MLIGKMLAANGERESILFFVYREMARVSQCVGRDVADWRAKKEQ